MAVKSKLEPRCLSGKGYGYSARGYLIPCCWLDPYETVDGQYPTDYKDVAEVFLQEHLKLSNVDTIDDIINSKEWEDFFETLIKDPDNAPRMCKKYCATKQSTKLRQEFGEAYNPSSTSAEHIVEVE